MNDWSRSPACALLVLLVGAGCRVAGPAPSAKLRRPIPAAEVALLQPPVQLVAGGEAIDVGDLNGYASPALFDGDGDGRLDLFVGSFDGKIRIYHNVGSAHAPTFAPGQVLKAEGKDFEISNW